MNKPPWPDTLVLNIGYSNHDYYQNLNDSNASKIVSLQKQEKSSMSDYTSLSSQRLINCQPHVADQEWCLVADTAPLVNTSAPPPQPTSLPSSFQPSTDSSMVIVALVVLASISISTVALVMGRDISLTLAQGKIKSK
jgi:hypothetical protein